MHHLLKFTIPILEFLEGPKTVMVSDVCLVFEMQLFSTLTLTN